MFPSQRRWERRAENAAGESPPPLNQTGFMKKGTSRRFGRSPSFLAFPALAFVRAREK